MLEKKKKVATENLGREDMCLGSRGRLDAVDGGLIHRSNCNWTREESSRRKVRVQVASGGCSTRRVSARELGAPFKEDDLLWGLTQGRVRSVGLHLFHREGKSQCSSPSSVADPEEGPGRLRICLQTDPELSQRVLTSDTWPGRSGAGLCPRGGRGPSA